MTGRALAISVEEIFKLKAHLNTIQKLRNQFCREIYPFRRSLQALIAIYRTRCGNDGNIYVISIADHRLKDERRQVRDQEGVSILMANEELLKTAVKMPRLGCDGTFGIVSSYDQYLNFELNTIVAKDDKTGKVFGVMRQLCSRKTVAARKILFKELGSRLVLLGLKDPLSAPIGKRMTMATDFETTYGFALGRALSEEFRSGSDMEYVQAVCFGCDVYAKRLVMEKCDISQDRSLFSWAVGTRNILEPAEEDEALRAMTGMGGKWESFAQWLMNNKVALFLWFHRYYSNKNPAELSSSVFWDTNPNEAMNARIKGLPSYLQTNRRGLDPVEAVNELKLMDDGGARNIAAFAPTQGIQYFSEPDWKRSQAKARKRNFDDVKVIDDELVPASQPKKSRKASKNGTGSTRPRTRHTVLASAEKVDALTRKTEELNSLVEKLMASQSNKT